MVRPEKARLFLRLLGYPLSARETIYLFWRFCYQMSNREMAKCDDRKISKQAVNQVTMRAYNKIKVFTLKKHKAYLRHEAQEDQVGISY